MSASEKKPQRQFAPEFTAQAVNRVLAGQAVAVVARELGIGERLLPTWVRRYD